MNKPLKSIFFFLLGLMGLLALLCSIAASCVTNELLMKQGFLRFADTKHLGVTAGSYADYAHGLAQYLDGKTERVQVPDPEEENQAIDAFSEKENQHLADVQNIVRFLKGVRWIGGGGAAVVIAGLYFMRKQDRSRLTGQLLRGFALAAMALLLLAAGIGIWGIVNFDGLFWTFHRVAFTNDLWLLNPATDLLVALMPLPFFTWYAGEMLKSMLPVLGMMLLLIVAWLKLCKEAEPKQAQ